MRPRRFLEWEAYFELKAEEQDPESVRQDWRVAAIRKTLADIFRGKDAQPYDIEIFRPKWVKKGEQQVVEKPKQQPLHEKVAIAKILAMAINAAYQEKQAAVAQV